MEGDPYYNHCGRGFYFAKEGKIEMELVHRRRCSFIENKTTTTFYV